MMKTLSRRLPLSACLICLWMIQAGVLCAAVGAPLPTLDLLKQAGSQGICALPGDREAAQAIALARETEWLFYVQLPGAAETETARRRAEAAGLYGIRIFIERGPLNQLYLADNVADVVIAPEMGASMPEAEAMRVVRPQGRVRLGQQEKTKPIPQGVEDWSHPYHGPDNNPVSRDQVARGPYLTQFLADPRYAPLPQVAVAAAGRIFKAFGHIAFKEREEPWLNTLAAFNGYNGALLWRRDIPPALMVHRNTLIATATNVYYGDDVSCKVLDASTGALKGEIAPPADQTGGTFWKWMAIEDGVLYALIGEQEPRDPVIRARRENHGWPWNPLSPGFNQPDQAWGYGKTLVAIDLATQKIRWRYQEDQPMDGRALCLKNGRLFAFSFDNYLTCLDAATGSQRWRHTRENAPELFEALGPYLKRQDWRTNWRTTVMMRCSDQALYFAGPAIHRLIAVSAEGGKVLWSHPYSNYQLILHDDALYGISGQIDNEVSRKFDPLTGQVLAELKINRRACTRPTASSDAMFFRAGEGSVRVDFGKNEPQLVSPMRPNCQDGVTVANGLLYWWPSVCDCNLSLYGITSLGPAGKFDFSQAASDQDRLETAGKASAPAVPLAMDASDWTTFRANQLGTVTVPVPVREQVRQLWEYSSKTNITPTAPTTAANLALVAGSDGVVRALDEQGRLAWSAFTGGEVRLPPTLAEGRALAGSGDGWVYAWDAKTGRQLWRFRAAPIERRIPVYGALLSTWPAASGVVVDRGIAYVAAGLANYDGTHVYALDAATGRIKWQNNTSGHLDPESRTGVGVQGQLMIRNGQLFLAGGNAVSPAIYDLADGQCLNRQTPGQKTGNGYTIGSVNPRGWELYQVGYTVRVAGKPYYAHPKYPVFDATVQNKTLFTTVGDYEVAWVNNTRLQCFANLGNGRAEFQARQWGKLNAQNPAPVWQQDFKNSLAMAVGNDAVVIATPTELIALNLKDGTRRWQQPLPAPPVPWGLAINRDGKVIVTLEGGRVICFG